MKAIVGPDIQDAGCNRFPGCDVPVYHTHGMRQYLGTCKYHASPDCRHLQHWTPGRRLGKTIMREWCERLDTIPGRQRCKTCWPNDKVEFQEGGEAE